MEIDYDAQLISHWINHVAKPATAPPVAETVPKKTAKRAIFYSISPESYGQPHIGTIRIKSWTQKKDGTLGRSSNVDVMKAAHRELSYLTESDLYFIESMIELSDLSIQSAPYDFRPSDSRFWHQLLEEMLEHQQVSFILSDDTTALINYRSDEPRTLGPRWQIDDTGAQRAVVAFEDSGAPFLQLGTATNYAIDLDQKTIHPVTFNFPEGLDQESWLLAPPIPHHLVDTVHEQLPAQLPTPTKVNFKTVSGVKPTPELEIGYADLERSIDATWRHHYRYREFHYSVDNLRKLPIGAVFMNYGDLRVPTMLLESDFQLVESFFQNSTQYEIERNESVEIDAVNQLVEVGLSHVSYRLPLSVPSFHHGHLCTFSDRKAPTLDVRWQQFIVKTLSQLERAGWIVRFDESFDIGIIDQPEWYADFDEGSGIEWLTFDYGIEVDGKKISLLSAIASYAQSLEDLSEIEALCTAPPEATTNLWLEETRQIIRMPSTQLGTMMKSLVELFNFEPGGSNLIHLHPLQAAQLANDFTHIAEGDTFIRLRKMGENLSKFDGLKMIAPSKSLQADLRPYQQDGLSWLQFLREHQLGGILADDMGLGKTVQTIASLLLEKESGRQDRPSLIVAPTSVLSNWVSEIEKFAPSLSVLLLHGPGRKTDFCRIPQFDLVVTSFPLLGRDAEHLAAEAYHYVVLDEAQTIKNPKSKVAQTACQIEARHRLCLSGTPLENHLGELWSLFHFLLPGFLGNADDFRKNFRRPIERDADTVRQQMLANRVRPLLLRRTKEHVLHELPERTEIVQTIQLDRAQAEIYEVIRASMDKRVRDAIADKGLARSHIIVLDALLKLRQTCCDPRLLKTEQAKKVKKSAKLEHLLTLVDQLIDEGRRILIFSQFTTMLGLISNELEQRGLAFSKLTGRTRDRKKHIDQFQNGDVPLFLISLKAGGTGLNLTAADTVIHYDPWWNPAVEEQATGRAHRMGQKKPVFVYKLVAQGTIEERIQELQKKKAAIARSILEPGEQNQKLSLQQSDLEHLFVPLEN